PEEHCSNGFRTMMIFLPRCFVGWSRSWNRPRHQSVSYIRTASTSMKLETYKGLIQTALTAMTHGPIGGCSIISKMCTCTTAPMDSFAPKGCAILDYMD